jgi:hypothetical protein
MSVSASRRGTLTANTPVFVTIVGDHDEVEVTNATGSAAIYYTIGNTEATTTEPTVAGTAGQLFQLPAAVVSRTHRRPAAEARTIVKLISSGTPGYDVQGINPKAVTS